MVSYKIMTYFALALASLTLSASYAANTQDIITCPAELDVMQALNTAEGQLLGGHFSTGIRFHVHQTVPYENRNDKSERFEGHFTTIPVQQYQPLKVTLGPATPVVYYYHTSSDEMTGIKSHSYISCRYKVIKSEPLYDSSDSYVALVTRGLTSLHDGYFNFESYVDNAECRVYQMGQVICTALTK